jgi:DNA-binding NtrC family response regulator
MMMVTAAGITSQVFAPEAATGTLPRSTRRMGLLDCLVVTGDSSRRRRFEAAAELAGWLECASPETSGELRQAIDRDFQLVIVDVASPLGDRVSDTLEIAEEMAARQGTLLVVCGSEDSLDEELWARQLGAWLYLPGVCSSDSLTTLFVEARRLRDSAPAVAAVSSRRRESGSCSTVLFSPA